MSDQDRIDIGPSGGFHDEEPSGKQRLNRNLKIMLEGKSITDGWDGDGKGCKSTEDPSVKAVPTTRQLEARIREESSRTNADEIALQSLRKKQMGGGN